MYTRSRSSASAAGCSAKSSASCTTSPSVSHVRKPYNTPGFGLLSFNTIHDRIRRCETGGLRDGTWIADELTEAAGLDIEASGFANELWESAQQSFSLDPNMGERKFGPHYVAVRTALSNIR